MNAAIVIVVLMVLLCLLMSVRRTLGATRCQSHLRPRSRRFVHHWKRQAASLQARELARAIIESRPDPTAHLAAGVILQPGEDAWLRVRARLAVRTSQPAWTAYTQVSWLGRRARNDSYETTTLQWQDQGKIDWLITSQRIVGRLSATGEMISVWWSGLAGIDIDLKWERIVLNGVNGWTGMLAGPAVYPLAVTAIAMCYGPEALLIHPALDELRQGGPTQPPLPEESEAVRSGGTVVRLPRRRPTT